MSNRRMGGMGGPRGNNRSFSQQPFQSGGGGLGLNPWQGGSPMQNNQGGGLLSQLTANPQLALALTTLLQSPQQQQMNPPSLLSLNTSPAFSNQNRDFDRFGGNRGREMRRHEPYNKNRSGGGGWRPMDRGNNRNNQRNQNRKRSPQKDNKNKKDDKDKKDIKKKGENKDKKESAETVDLSMDEDKDESKESKRDWKDEKNQSEDRKSESGDDDDDEKGEEKDGKDSKDAKNKEGKYSGVPIKFLNCFVCNKEMWDGESMWKHIRGRAHGQMLKSLEESIHITVSILRENMRLAEEKKMIERNRVQRLKKFSKYNEEIESHCNMCDLKFLGKINAHRRTVGHQRLKRYLHPDCKVCDKEFPSRLDWIDHRLTPEHLKKLSDDNDARIGGINGMDVFKVEEESLEPLLDEALQMEVENPILEVDDNLENLQNLMPAYKKDRPVATKSLKAFSGFMCELCQRVFENEEMAQGHLKTLKHYYTFVGVIKQKHKQDLIKKDKKQEKEKTKSEGGDKDEDQNMYDPEEATNEDDEEEEDETEVTINDMKEEDLTGDPSTLSLDSSQLKEEDVEMTEAESEVKKEEELLKDDEEEEKEEKEKVVVQKKGKAEPVKKEEVASPVKAVAGGKAAVKGNVKNGAGPRSKKARK